MKLTKFDVLAAFVTQYPNAKIHPDLARRIRKEEAVTKVQDPQNDNTPAPGDSEDEIRRKEQEGRNRMPVDAAKVVSALRELLSQMPAEQAEEVKAAVLAELSETKDDPDEDDGESLERVDLKKSKAQPGSFTDLFVRAVRAWNDPNGFTNSLKTDAKPLEIFSKEHLQDEAARVEKDDDTPPRTIWGRRRGVSITHI